MFGLHALGRAFTEQTLNPGSGFQFDAQQAAGVTLQRRALHRDAVGVDITGDG
jgi:hypothetical protein